MYRHSYGQQIIFPRSGSCVKSLIILNLICWFFLVSILQSFFMKSGGVYQVLGFVPSAISNHFFIWQFFTYMFIHSAGVFHILFNMMVLWMFGSELEQLWRKKFFLLYYLVCGVGSALVYYIGVNIYLFFGGVSSVAVLDTPVVGASGAVFGLLLAYGWIFGDRIVLFMFIFPMKARTFTLLIAGVELMTMLSSGLGSPVSNLAHLGGLLSGFLFLNFRSITQKFRSSGLFKRGLFKRQKRNIFILKSEKNKIKEKWQ